MNPRKIGEVVCKNYDIPIESLNLPDRKLKHVEPCQVAHFFAYILTDLSEEKIGKSIGNKDHATVINSIKSVLNAFQTNRVYRTVIRYIGNDIMIESLKDITPKLSMSTYPERKAMYLNLAK